MLRLGYFVYSRNTTFLFRVIGTFPSPLLSDEVGPYGGVAKSTDFLYEVGNVFLRL